MGSVSSESLMPMPVRRPSLAIHKFQHSMGPRNIPFAKLSPKTMELEEEERLSEGPADPPSLPCSEEEPSEEEVAEIEEEIKIRWNSFIKMKKKNYLEDYTVVKEIGRGGFGTVSKVIAKYTGVVRAAKKIKKSALGKS